MKLTRALFRLMAVIGVTFAAVALPDGLAAQTGGTTPPGEPTLPRLRRLAGASDEASSDLRSVGYFTRVCAENATGAFDADFSPCAPFFQTMNNGFTAVWAREAHWSWAVPKTTWDSAVAKVPSLAAAIGGGWTVMNIHQTGNDDLAAADGGLGLHHAGVTTVNDNSCRDHGTSIGSGNPLLAGSNCPETWGSEGWRGARPIPPAVWESRATANPATFTFDPWRVSDAELDAAGVIPPTPGNTGDMIGSFQTYGFTSDFTAEILCGTSVIRNYAHVIPTTSQVVPGGCTSSDPTRRRHGWPLGIEVRFDAFTFQLPKLKEISYYQVTFTNKSELVYGIPLDYDSVYISLQNGWFGNSNIQQNPTEWAPEQGLMVTSALPLQAPCVAGKIVSDLTCARWGANFGFVQGAAALMVLKSPIGDLRNKLFARPGTPYSGLRPDLADDTITFNHGHLCGFRNCGRLMFATDPATTPDHERRGFGQMSSTESNAFGNRAISSLTDNEYWHTFRNFAFPTRLPAVGGGYNKWVPGGWDYNNDGTPDTLAIDGCYVNGCARMFSDTLPNGKYSAYSNTHGTLGVGPIKLRADSTVSYIIAITTAQANDSLGFVRAIQAATDNYMSFFIVPQSAPKCRITGVTRASAVENSSIGLAWDDSCLPGKWLDKFLNQQYLTYASAAPNTRQGRIAALNPWLVDTLDYLRNNNLRRLYVYKSCNDGGVWTTADDCITGSPATGGLLLDIGWLPYATYDADAATPIPTTFNDVNVRPGLTYTYNVIGETRGAFFIIQNGDSIAPVGVGGANVCVLSCRVDTLDLAPVLFHAPSGSTGEPNTGRAYLPLSMQAGGSRSRVTTADSAGPLPPDRLGFTVTDDSLVAATYKVLFADSARATQLEYRTGVTLDSTRTRTLLRVPASLGDSVVILGTNRGGLTASGSAAVVTTPSPGVTSVALTWASGPVMALTRRPGAANVDALLVTNTLTGASATPGGFHTNLDYPRFDLSISGTLTSPSTVFAGQTHRDPNGDVVGPLVEPTVVWLADSASRDTVLSANQANGDYVIAWGGQPFGSGGSGGSDQFRLDFSNPSATATAIAASIGGRAAVSTGVTTAVAAAAIDSSTGVRTTLDSLIAVRLPFTITNQRYNRPVVVAMRRRPAARQTIIVGFGADTIRVTPPADAWVPGDQLYFLEDVSGVQRVTFRRAEIGCDASRHTRRTCNPVYPGTVGSTVYLGQTAGQQTRFRYHGPITAASSFTLAASAPMRGAPLTSNPGAVRSGLGAVRVVPNPYVMLSQYPGNVLLFTHMPPRGVIRIYTVAGQFVQQITWDENDLGADGDLSWNLRTREGNLLAAGLYLYVLTATDATGGTVGTRTDKFVVIR